MKWIHEGREYHAKRDDEGYIYIVDTENNYPVGRAFSYDWCLRWNEVPELAKRLGVWDDNTSNKVR